ncbi:MAG: DUF1844 domain-containing protein [Thermoguttaceae bacterium]|jgi:hypothetical protein
MNTEQTPEKKLVIDEDWKSQVQAEKDAARQAEPPQKSAEPPAGTPTGRHLPLPPADLLFLIGTLYIQGAMALGLLPNPVTKKAEVQLDQAKHSIDLLAVLQQKTEGNRTPQESEELEAALHELRMEYVAVPKD